VFDLRAGRVTDLKPMHDKQLSEQKVTCIDVSSNM
jgi:hypothetical protein